MQSRMARSVDTTISTGQATSNNLLDTAGTSFGAAQNSAVASTGNQQELSMSTVSFGATVSTTIKDGEGVSTQATADASQNADTANATTGVNVNAQQALKAYKDMGDSSAQAKQDSADHLKYLNDLFAKQNNTEDQEILAKMWDGSPRAPLQQAGVSALGQANQAQQQVLSLYRG